MSATPASSPTSGPPFRPPAPPRVPDHELIRRIGKGAYGEVWLARAVTGAFRAVKIVHRTSFDQDRPFEREFEGILQFEPISRRHDSQVNILHVGHGEDCFYYVMELADDQATGGQIPNPDLYQARTLKSDLLFHGRLPFEECVRIGIALTTALEHLHAHGLVHRDVKPSNIIFINGVPKLADIGLVTGLDATRSFVGTEGFAAPEGAGTPQADLFSLGKVLYETATGKDRQEFPELPTQLRELPDREGLMELNAVIAKACRHDPKDRYASAAAMRADLELLRSGKSLARLHHIREQLRFVRRAGALVTVLAALIAGGWLWQARQTDLVRSLAEQKSRLVSEKSHLAEDARQRLIRLGIANGTREVDRGDLGSALLWLTEALALTTNLPSDEAIQRIRLNHLLTQHPRLLHILPHPAPVLAAAMSPDEQHVVSADAAGELRIWRLDQDEKPAASFKGSGTAETIRFMADARRLLWFGRDALKASAHAALLDILTGKPVLPVAENVTCAALSPDDRWLAVARADHSVEIIAAQSGQTLTLSNAHTDRIESLDFSADGAVLLTAGRDRTVRRWAVTSGREIQPALPHDFPVARALFNRDASRIATATCAAQFNDPIQFQTWDATTGRPVGDLLRGWGMNCLLAFDPSGRRLLTADRESRVRLWNADAHTLIVPPLELDGPARLVDFSPDGAWLAVGTERGTVRIWEAESGRPAFSPLRNAGGIRSLKFSPDGRRLLMVGGDGMVKVWGLALATDDDSRRFTSTERPGVVLVAEGRQLLLGLSGPTRLCLADAGNLRSNLPALPAADNYVSGGILVADHSGNQWASAPGPEGLKNLRAAMASAPSTVGLWRHEAGQIRYSALPHPARVRGVFFHRDGTRLLTASADHTARIWRASDGALEQTIAWPKNDLAWLAVSPDLRVAVVYCGEEDSWRLAFRDVASGATIRAWPEVNPEILAVAFSPDGQRVGLAADNQNARVWAVHSGEALSPPVNHGAEINCLQWSPDGRRLLTAGQSPEIRVWDAASGAAALPPLVMKIRPVELARFSSDGRFIVARCDEDLVRVWDAATGEAVTPFLPHQDTLKDVFITPAQQLVSIQNSGEVRVWNLKENPITAVDLSTLAGLLTGHVPADSATGSGDSSATASLLRRMRDQQPDWFELSTRQAYESFCHQAQAGSLDKVRTTLFHLERQHRQNPGDLAIQNQLAHCRTLLIPDRAAATPPHLLDLSRAYTQSFELLPRGEFAELPRGRQTLAGTEFDLRGFIHLNHRAERADAPGPFHPVAAIETGIRCRALHFLQAATDDPRVEGSVAARWIMHYADGTTREWPVRYGEHVRDLWWRPANEPLEARKAVVAWRGRAAIGHLPGTEGVRLFKATWTNPAPESAITRLEFQLGETSLKPLVVAITAE